MKLLFRLIFISVTALVLTAFDIVTVEKLYRPLSERRATGNVEFTPQMEGRDGDWERDLYFFADVLLMRHASLGGLGGFATNIDNLVFGGSRGHGGFISDFFYDAEINRELFIESVNDLLVDIPILEDWEVQFRMLELITTLNDAHTLIQPPLGGFIPMFAKPFHNGYDYCFYVVSTSYRELLGQRVTAINGIYMDEVVARLGRIRPRENDYILLFAATHLITFNNYLIYIDVVGRNDESVEITSEDEQGNSSTVTIQIIEPESVVRGNIEFFTFNEQRMSMLKNAYIDKNYWYEHIFGTNVLYIRHRHSIEMEQNPTARFIGSVTALLSETPEIDTLVYDLRSNGGGEPTAALADLIEFLSTERETLNVFILVNENTFSAGVINAAILRRHIPNSLIVGSPAGQPPNFLGLFEIYTLPVSRAQFHVSRAFGVSWPGYEYNALMPDIVIHQTFEDFINGRDTALEAIKSGKRKG